MIFCIGGFLAAEEMSGVEMSGVKRNANLWLAFYPSVATATEGFSIYGIYISNMSYL
ncbi:hypothetical protein ccbrp13_06300 [Ktedonobacteria bacterium brp13]|nr:hypothetical protein ccbrp13_06300 [Ktedonobacteria bacterium brp13]